MFVHIGERYHDNLFISITISGYRLSDDKCTVLSIYRYRQYFYFETSDKHRGVLRVINLQDTSVQR